MRWDRDDLASPESLARMKALPGFAEAARRLNANMLHAYTSDRGVQGIFKDAGRYVAAMLAIYLDVNGGLTLPRLKALGAAFGMISPGRARALLLYLRYLRYVEPVPTPSGQPARYAPTQAFITAWRRHMVAALEAAAVAEPALEPFMNRLCAPDALDVVTRIQSEGLRAATEAHGAMTDLTIYQVFVQRHAGSQVLWRLICGSEGQAFPPLRTPAVPAAEMARLFSVSRIHVRRMLDDAERRGFLSRDADGSLRFSPDAREEVENHFAVQLSSLVRAASKALLELTEPARATA
jgi:hypothetical protein